MLQHDTKHLHRDGRINELSVIEDAFQAAKSHLPDEKAVSSFCVCVCGFFWVGGGGGGYHTKYLHRDGRINELSVIEDAFQAAKSHLPDEKAVSLTGY